MPDRKKITYPYSGETVKQCLSCEAMIYFYRNPKSQKLMPVSFETKESHFADCPAAAQFRRPKA